jgi:hypothetical protein
MPDLLGGLRTLIATPAKASPSSAILVEDLKRLWRRVGNYELAHWRAAEKYARTHQRLGAVSAGFTAVVSGSAFVSLTQSSSTTLTIATGTAAALAALLTALLTFLSMADRSKKHLVAGASLGAVRRAVDFLRMNCAGPAAPTYDKAIESFKKLSDEFSAAVQAAPGLSKEEYETGEREFFEKHPRNGVSG